METIHKGIALIMLVMILNACGSDRDQEKIMKMNDTVDLSRYPGNPPENPLHLLFIHHSTGGQMLADHGPDVGKNCIYTSHPNGGGLRKRLEQSNYIVHEASYGSFIGNDTDICHWNAKFRDHMDKILSCKNQDEFFSDGTRNSIVVFKSCFPNSWIDADGTGSGNPDSCQHSTVNYMAAYRNLLAYFSSQPETLFIVMTAPPLAMPFQARAKVFVKHLLGRSDSLDVAGNRIRYFNNWLKDSKNGWLSNYPHVNIAVFDYYDTLTGHGKSDWSIYGSEGGRDSHPSSLGNSIAAEEFLSFLNKAVNRMKTQIRASQ